MTRHRHPPRTAKQRAYRLTRDAIAAGFLVRPAQCQQCQRVAKIQAHHEDYDKPLDVMWLCQRCHSGRHAELRRLHPRQWVRQVCAPVYLRAVS